MNEIKIFTGNSNPKLVNQIVQHLEKDLSEKGLKGQSIANKFSDGETQIEIGENVRGHDVFIIQSTNHPTNDNLMELILMIDACKRSSAGRITAVVPYFGYARQDRRTRSARVPISAKVVANMIKEAGANKVITVDLHSDQVQGFFDIPVDNIYSSFLFVEDIKKHYVNEKTIVVSPDVGGTVRARAVGKLIDNPDLAIIDKRRPAANVSEVMNVIGDVNGKTCILIDDMVDTAGTLCKAAKALKERGAIKVVAYITHPVLSGKAFSNIKSSVIDELVVTDSIAWDEKDFKGTPIRQISLSGTLSEVIKRVHQEKSLTEMFE